MPVEDDDRWPDSGVTEDEIHQMTVENPRRIFECCQPY
jgi:predicted metal-dependent phosphotriesterase family hydrolase